MTLSVVQVSARVKLQSGSEYTGSGSSEGEGGIKSLFVNVYSNFEQVADLMGGAAYLAGVIFVFAAMMKIKQHRDNPAQVPVTTGLVFLLAGVGLIFLPSTLSEGATTLFTSIDDSYTGVSQSNIGNNPWAKP